jgi:hypothetical protein
MNGCLLFYARAVDSNILPAVCEIASDMARPTQAALAKADRIMAYLSGQPPYRRVYHACDMQLKIESDASFLSRSQSRSVAGGIMYCGNKNDKSLNAPIQCISSIIPTVCASAAEAEYAALFMNGQIGSWLRVILNALGYPQHEPTPIKCDNKCAVGIATDSVRPKRTKAIDMRYNWIRDKVRSKMFHVFWEPGEFNLADFYTKALPIHRFKSVRGVLSPDQKFR